MNTQSPNCLSLLASNLVRCRRQTWRAALIAMIILASLPWPLFSAQSSLYNGDVFKTPSDPSVYLFYSGKKHQIMSWDVLESCGYQKSNIKTISSASYPSGDPISNTITCKKYIDLILTPNSAPLAFVQPPNDPEALTTQPTTLIVFDPAGYARYFVEASYVESCPEGLQHTYTVSGSLLDMIPAGKGSAPNCDLAVKNYYQFSLIFMSDPQYDWGCSEEDSSLTEAEYCQKTKNLPDRAQQAATVNRYQIESIANIKAGSPNTPSALLDTNLMGAVINGDLTNFGNQNKHLYTFLNYYSQLQKDYYMELWPGLGNHDYENPVNKCHMGVGPSNCCNNSNYCAYDMIQYLAGLFQPGGQSVPYAKNFDVQRYERNPLQCSFGACDHEPIESSYNISGSLSYSWDIGNFHFVQLHNYPTYERSFDYGYSSGVNSWNIHIYQSLDWLKSDLANTTKDHVVLNWHKYSDLPDSDREQIKDALRDYAPKIAAIFVGHHHNQFGITDYLEYDNSSIKIPVIHSGSSIYNRYVYAYFDTSNGCTIKTQVINGYQGNVQAVPGSSEKYKNMYPTGSFEIDCTPNQPPRQLQ